LPVLGDAAPLIARQHLDGECLASPRRVAAYRPKGRCLVLPRRLRPRTAAVAWRLKRRLSRFAPRACEGGCLVLPLDLARFGGEKLTVFTYDAPRLGRPRNAILRFGAACEGKLRFQLGSIRPTIRRPKGASGGFLSARPEVAQGAISVVDSRRAAVLADRG
jgi:hypothetical protein